MLTPVEPRVRVNVADVQALNPARWQVSWLVHNDGPASLALDAAWIPHGKFRGDGRLPLSGDLPAGESTQLAFLVTAHEHPGATVENAFLILRVLSQGQTWRIFTRMRIDFDAQAIPRPLVELITVQKSEVRHGDGVGL
jgi:hypothetical protein